LPDGGPPQELRADGVARRPCLAAIFARPFPGFFHSQSTGPEAVNPTFATQSDFQLFLKAGL